MQEKFFANLNVINYFPCERGFSTLPRIFDYPYLLYIHGGKGKYKIGEKIYQCEQGDLFYCKKKQPNTIMADANNPFILSGIEFTVNSDEYLNESMPEKINIGGNAFGQCCIEKMLQEYLYNKKSSSEIGSYILSAFLLEIFRHVSQAETVQKFGNINLIFEYVAENIGEKLLIEDICKKFHYHRNTVYKLIKENTGLSANEYIIRQKIKEAQKNLVFTDKSVEEIASLLGYSSTAFFCRQFKKKTGDSPTKYRKKRI